MSLRCVGGKKYWLILKRKLQNLKLVHRSKTTPGHWVRVVWQVLGIGETIRSCYLSLSTITTAHYMLSLIRYLELLFYGKELAMGLFCHFQLSPLNTACSNHI